MAFHLGRIRVILFRKKGPRTYGAVLAMLNKSDFTEQLVAPNWVWRSLWAQDCARFAHHCAKYMSAGKLMGLKGNMGSKEKHFTRRQRIAILSESGIPS